MFQLLSAPQADKFLFFKMDPLPIYTVHKQNKYQDFRQRLFTSKSNPAAPVSGENYLTCTVLFIMQLVNTFIINTPDTTDGQPLMAFIPLEVSCLLPLKMCLLSFLSPSKLQCLLLCPIPLFYFLLTLLGLASGLVVLHMFLFQ